MSAIFNPLKEIDNLRAKGDVALQEKATNLNKEIIAELKGGYDVSEVRLQYAIALFAGRQPLKATEQIEILFPANSQGDYVVNPTIQDHVGSDGVAALIGLMHETRKRFPLAAASFIQAAEMTTDDAAQEQYRAKARSLGWRDEEPETGPTAGAATGPA